MDVERMDGIHKIKISCSSVVKVELKAVHLPLIHFFQ
jgi:hypothetical protein